MSVTVALRAATLDYPQGGGHLWVYLNWALGLRAVGCRVIWLEEADAGLSRRGLCEALAVLRARLAPHGLGDAIAVHDRAGGDAAPPDAEGVLALEAVDEADLLLDIGYSAPARLVRRFPRTALVDIDPGLLQLWLEAGSLEMAPHHVYFTIGETVGTPEARFPDAGLVWHHTPPPVFLPAWPVLPADPAAPYTTVSHWWDEWLVVDGVAFDNSKRAGFAPFLDLPPRARSPLELALDLPPDDGGERAELRRRGWRVAEAWQACGTPDLYRRYIQRSRGELSCTKPSCLVLANAWVSDRTLCYLASGRPAIVQHTGASRLLPDADGLFRFRTLDEALAALEAVEGDHEAQSRRARELVEVHFDAERVVTGVLERALAG